jgi:hypothetical protein
MVTQLLKKLVGFIRNFLQRVAGFLFNHRYHLDDIIAIVRPFLYVYAIVRCGHRSYTPVRLSFILDVIGILVSFSRLVQAADAPQPQ